MPPSSRLLLPSPDLAGCVFAAIERDTRGIALSRQDRFNHFPASPLIALTLVLEGTLNFVQSDGTAVAMPSLFVAGAQNTPSVSFSDGPVHVLTIAIFPDAWMRLTGKEPQEIQDQIQLDVPAILLIYLILRAVQTVLMKFGTGFATGFYHFGARSKRMQIGVGRIASAIG